MANQNGIGAQNAAAYNNVNGPVLPSAGHFSDMQTLMQNMEGLSGWLEQNRQDWTIVQEGLARVERLQAQGRLAREAAHPFVNGDSTQSHPEDSPTLTQLQTALSGAHQRIAALEQTYNDQIHLQQLYEDTLTDATERLRTYCFEQQNHVAALHAHYTHVLSQSRSETIEAQLLHQAWQAGLSRVSEGVRAALKSREEEGKPWKKRIAALKEENRILRAKVGWQPPVESEDEDEEGEGEVEEPVQRDVVRGRMGRGRAPNPVEPTS